jgi:hypothetical protein
LQPGTERTCRLGAGDRRHRRALQHMTFSGVGRADDVAALSNGFAQELRHLRDAITPAGAESEGAAQSSMAPSERKQALQGVLANGGLVNTDAVRSAGLPGLGAFGARLPLRLRKRLLAAAP